MTMMSRPTFVKALPTTVLKKSVKGGILGALSFLFQINKCVKIIP